MHVVYRCIQHRYPRVMDLQRAIGRFQCKKQSRAGQRVYYIVFNSYNNNDEYNDNAYIILLSSALSLSG